MSPLHAGPLSRYGEDGRVAARILDAALAAVEPGACVQRELRLRDDALVAGSHVLPLRGGARVWLLSVGKAAVAMARAALPLLAARLGGAVVIAKHGPDAPIDAVAPVELHVGAHPIPDESSIAAGRAAIALVQRAGPDDVVVVALSGGASALMVAPTSGVSLSELAARTEALLRSGAPIHELNRMRASVDRIKGGGLGRLAAPTRLVTLVLSDVVDAPLEVVGSGPTLPGLAVELGSNATAVAAAMEAARAEGWHVESWPGLRGEAREVGRELGQRLRDFAGPLPTVFVAGGETTVTVRGHGRGGRNQELALAAIEPLRGATGRMLVTLATDGEDGPTDAAGAVVTGDSAPRASAAGLDVAERLLDDDAYPVFEALHDLLRIGPTGTNVCDLVLGLARA